MNKKEKMKAALDSLFTPAARPQTQEPGNGNWQTVAAAAIDLPVVEDAIQTPEDRTVVVPVSLAAAEPAASEPAASEPPAQTTTHPVSVEPAAVPTPTAAQQAQPAASQVSGVEKQLVVFQLGEEFYGMGIEAVEGIIKMQGITKVPHMPGYVCGVTNLRGTVLPVVDLRARFNLPKKETTRDTRIIVLKSNGLSAGVVVDAVSEVVRVPTEAIEPAPSIALTIESAYVEGLARCAEKIIILLELDKILRIGQRNGK